MDGWSSARRTVSRDLADGARAAPLSLVLLLSLFMGLPLAGCGMLEKPFAGGSHDPPTDWKGSALEFCREDQEGYHCFYSGSQCFHWASWNGERWEGDEWACSF